MKIFMMITTLSFGCISHALYKTKLHRVLDTNCKERIDQEKALELKAEQDIKRYFDTKVQSIQKNGQLIVAVWQKNLHKVQALLKQDADVNVELENCRDDVAGISLWCWALFTARNPQDKQILNALLTDNVDFIEDYRTRYGHTPFMCAAIFGYLDVAKFLYERGKALYEDGLSINAKDNKGLTALWYWVGNNHIDGVHFLLSCPNINIGIKNEKQESLLEYAIKHDMPEIAEALLWSRAAKRYIAQEEKDVLLKRMLCEKNERMIQILVISGAGYHPSIKKMHEIAIVMPQPQHATKFIITDVESSEADKPFSVEAPLTTSSDSSHESVIETCEDIDKAFASIQ